MNSRSILTHAHIIIALISAFLAAIPLLAPGYFSSAHDARHSVYLLQMFDANIREGVLIPRWGADVTFGYGYPVWIIFAPLPYYAAELFHLVGFDFVWAIKLVYVCALIASALGMYLFGSTILGKDSGVVAAVAYTFIPYHLVDLYVRAAWPETISFVFLPLILWGMHQIAATRRTKYVALVALAYGGLILTHILTTFLFSLFIGAYLVLLLSVQLRHRTFRPSLMLLPTTAILLGIGVGALFLVPAILEQPFLSQAPFTGSFFDFRKHYITLAQMLSPFWGYGYAGISGDDQFSLQLGVIPLTLGLFALFAVDGKTEPNIRIHAWFFAIITFIVIVGMLQQSQPIWELFGRVGAFVQFPWRLLTITSFGLAFLCGVAANYVSDRLYLFAIGFLVIIAVFPNAQPQYTDAVFTPHTLMEFELKDHELLGDTVWLQGPRPTDSPLAESYLNGTELRKFVAIGRDARIDILEHRTTSDRARVSSNEDVQILVLTHYFPGWSMYIDGQRSSTSDWEISGEQGLMLVHVPAGEHIVETRFGETLPRLVGEVTTGISLLVVVGLLIRHRMRPRQTE